MQTLLAHTRLNLPFRPHAISGLFFGVGLSVAAAVAYAPFSFLVGTSLLLASLQCLSDPTHPLALVAPADLTLFIHGTLSGQITLALGAKRASVQLRWGDVLCAPAYWCL